MEPKDDDKYWRIQFSLHKLISPCVCASDLGEDSLCGWKQREERKERRKRIELSRAERQNSLSRKNREKPSEPPSPCDGFVFRHYEESHRYIEQYRENHSLSRVDSDVELRPVLGVDVPDPYLPKICHTRFVYLNYCLFDIYVCFFLPQTFALNIHEKLLIVKHMRFLKKIVWFVLNNLMW